MSMKSDADKNYLIPRVSAHLVSDILAVAVGWIIAFVIRFYLMDGQNDQELLFTCLGLVAICLTVYFQSRNKMYEVDFGLTWRKMVGRNFKSASEVFITLTVLYYFFFHDKISRMNLIMAYVLMFVMLVLFRSMTDSWMSRAFQRGKYLRRVLLVGKGERLSVMAKTLAESEGIRLVGSYLSDGSLDVPNVEADSLSSAVSASEADLVIISFPFVDKSTEDKVLAEGQNLLETKVYLLPHIPSSYCGSVISDFHYVPTIQLNAAEPNLFQRAEKRTFDIVSCSLAVVLLSPVFVILALLVKLSSKGPVFFKQKRVTRDGKVFTMLKFRSMRTDMPEQGGAHWTEENDPRVTKIGRIMRKTSLDELPQFFNVIGGSMSLIGPRPERPELVEKFVTEIPGYNMRHRMKAGISGWAQVNGLRGNTSLTKRIDFDLYYIRNWSIWFDFKIVFMTFFKGFVNKNAY